MFLIERELINGFEVVTLVDADTQTRAKVVPNSGGILIAFEMPVDGKVVNIIDGYNSKIEFNESVTNLGFKGCKLSPFVCRLKNGSYDFGGNKNKIEKFYLGKHALHGLLYNCAFRVSHEQVNDSYVSITMQYQYRKDDPGYPYNYDCSITYKLERENKLTVYTEVNNLDKGLIPIQDGWHPYFTLSESIDELQMEFQSLKMVSFDDELIPTGQSIPYNEFGSLKVIGTSTFDNCFELNFAECQPMFVLRNPARKFQVEILPDRSYPYLQIYTPPHRRSIAVENLSSPPNAFNNNIGLTILESGQKKIFTTSFKISIID